MSIYFSLIVECTENATWLLLKRAYPVGGRLVHETATYTCDDTRGCVIQFWPSDDVNIVLETCRGMK